MHGKPPPLEGDSTEDKPAKVKVEPLNSTEKGTQEAQGTETKVNVDVSKVLRREFKIHGVESGIKAGYKETEIVEAVIRAVSPSLKLSRTWR